MMNSKFTSKQISDWRAYEKVRVGGRYNMFDPRAISLSGLTKDDYIFAMENYIELMQEANPK